mmetsp:Transcript_9009/g.27357  ORF Transcript_9009/g.27357 Transcript_9009/m.27357 type:complete len:216 (+) Transcript_9009:432-1079(+)
MPAVPQWPQCSSTCSLFSNCTHPKYAGSSLLMVQHSPGGGGSRNSWRSRLSSSPSYTLSFRFERGQTVSGTCLSLRSAMSLGSSTLLMPWSTRDTCSISSTSQTNWDGPSSPACATILSPAFRARAMTLWNFSGGWPSSEESRPIATKCSLNGRATSISSCASDSGRCRKIDMIRPASTPYSFLADSTASNSPFSTVLKETPFAMWVCGSNMISV